MYFWLWSKGGILPQDRLVLPITCVLALILSLQRSEYFYNLEVFLWDKLFYTENTQSIQIAT